MHRWILIFVVAVQAAVLITLSGPMEAVAATSNNFKGKASVYYRTPPPGSEYSPYFVVNFTCRGGTLSGNWTWDTSNETSYGGTLAATDCSLSGPPWSSGTPMSTITLSPRGGGTATLNLGFLNIKATKTYVLNTTTCASNPPCIVIQTHGLGQAVKDQDGDFNSNPEPLPDATAPYGTLTLSVG
jgi:hypothetical protein